MQAGRNEPRNMSDISQQVRADLVCNFTELRKFKSTRVGSRATNNQLRGVWGAKSRTWSKSTRPV